MLEVVLHHQIKLYDQAEEARLINVVVFFI